MRFMTWTGGMNFELGECDVPHLDADQVLINVETVGVCGTDVHITEGLFPWTPPAILGHEGSGTIVDVGTSISKDRIGQKVTINVGDYCGTCEACLTWQIGRCEKHQQRHGFFSEFVAVASNLALILPENMDPEMGAFTEPASCCLSGVRMLEQRGRKFGLVIGGGIMGLFTLAFLKNAGVDQVIISEPVKSRREMALQFGADFLHDPSESDLDEFVKDLTNGYGVEVAVEAVGKPELVAKCVELTRPRGDVLMIGVCPPGTSLPIDLFDFHYREIRIQSAFGRGNVFNETPEEIMKLDLSGVISGRYSLENIPDAINDVRAGKGIKFVVKPNE